MFNWTKENCAELERLFRQELSAREIGRQLGCSRNAVIGKLVRSGIRDRDYADGSRKIPKRKPPSPCKATRNEKSPYRPVGFVAPVIEGDSPENPPQMARLSILELDGYTCRWPVGHPREPDFFFCGNATPGEGPYCAHHAEIAKVPRNRINFEPPTGGFRYGSKEKN